MPYARQRTGLTPETFTVRNPPPDLSTRYPLRQDLVWQPTALGFMNENWIGCIAARPAFVARRYRRASSVEEIALEHSLLSYLDSRVGHLVASPLVGTDGATIQEVDGGYFALFPFRPGELMGKGSRHAIEPAARAQAGLHTQLAGFPTPTAFPRLRPGLLDRNRSIEPSLASFLRQDTEAEAARRQGVTVETLGQALAELEPVFDHPTLRVARRIPIHADYGPHNILWDPNTGEIMTVLDWEETRFDLPIVDMTVSSTIFAPTPEERDEYIAVYLDELARLDGVLADEVRETLPHASHLERAAWLGELLLTLRLARDGVEPLTAGYVGRIARMALPTTRSL